MKMLDKNTLRRASNLVDSEGVERLTVTLFHPGQGYCLPAPTKVWFRSRIVSWLRGLQQRKDIHDLRAETGPSLPPISSSFPPARHYRAWTDCRRPSRNSPLSATCISSAHTRAISRSLLLTVTILEIDQVTLAREIPEDTGCVA